MIEVHSLRREDLAAVLTGNCFLLIDKGPKRFSVALVVLLDVLDVLGLVLLVPIFVVVSFAGLTQTRLTTFRFYPELV